MNFVWDGIQQAADLLVHGDHDIFVVVGTTLRVALWSTLFALALGLPLGLLLGLGRFRGRRAGLAVANAGMGLPPVVVGLVAALLLFRGAPLGGLDLLYTLNGVILAQTLLALPIVIALTVAAVRRVPAGLLDQAEAFGAPAWRRGVLAVREARRGVTAAVIAALGTAIASVGAVIVIGNSLGSATLATATLTSWNAGGSDAHAVAYGTVLLAMFLVLAAALTVVQEGRAGWIPGRRS